jgi:hypothetical protein
VRITAPGTSITFANIYTAFLTQLPGIQFVDGIFSFRLMSIRIWGPIPVTNVPLRAVFRDVFDEVVGVTPAGAQSTLEVVENYGDQVNRARVGYVYSSVQQQRSNLAAGTDPIVSLSGAGTGSVAYVQILWRGFRTTAALSEQDVSANSIRKNIQVLSLE